MDGESSLLSGPPKAQGTTTGLLTAGIFRCTLEGGELGPNRDGRGLSAPSSSGAAILSNPPTGSFPGTFLPIPTGTFPVGLLGGGDDLGSTGTTTGAGEGGRCCCFADGALSLVFTGEEEGTSFGLAIEDPASLPKPSPAGVSETWGGSSGRGVDWSGSGPYF